MAVAETMERFPDTVHTIHRLLGLSETDFGARYHQGHRLAADIVIIDEASMVSLSLMVRLFAAIRPETRLVLLGDKNQLASVEAGAVLGDICAAASPEGFSDDFRRLYEGVTRERLSSVPADENHLLSDRIVELRHNFRFPEGSVLDVVSRAVNRGDAEKTVSILDQDNSGMIVREKLPDRGGMGQRLAHTAFPVFRNMCLAATAGAALEALETFRILCAHRHGLYGVENLNRLVERDLAARGLIDPTDPFYRGRPIMITRNDHSLKLYNGDVGIIWDDADGNRQACFADPPQGLRLISPLRLPSHETVYAMTVHKSQGSEFDALLMILPDSGSAILTRELVYTGLTRARRQVTLWADDEILKTAVRARISRRSGLRDALK